MSAGPLHELTCEVQPQVVSEGHAEMVLMGGGCQHAVRLAVGWQRPPAVTFAAAHLAPAVFVGADADSARRAADVTYLTDRAALAPVTV